MSCGAPVVCSNRTSLPEVVGDAALSIDPEDTQALVEAMRS
ncbi:MAG: glycosyltransferase family 4 protein, partial [Chloroflexota bacterium]